MANDGTKSTNLTDAEQTTATGAALTPPEHTTQAHDQPKRGALQPTRHTDAENSLAMVMSVWWSFAWRFVLLFFAASFMLGIVLTFVTGGDVVVAERWGAYFTLIVTIPISIWSMGKALTRTHKQHRIIFTKDET